MKFSHLTISQIEDWLRTSFWKEIEAALPQVKADPRKGVRLLGERWEQRIALAKEAWQRWDDLCRRERELVRQGWRYVAGVDEAGRGPLAGPVVAAAVILPKDASLLGLDDSKRLSAQQRVDLYEQITSCAVAWAVGSAGPEYIDAAGILQATRKAMAEAIQGLSINPDYLLLDAVELPGCKVSQECIIGGDRKCACIAAASVVAKVTRDRWMEEWDKEFPGYGFARHKGYPTREHLAALARLGPCPLHRRSFQPLATLFPFEGKRAARGGESDQ